MCQLGIKKWNLPECSKVLACFFSFQIQCWILFHSYFNDIILISSTKSCSRNAWLTNNLANKSSSSLLPPKWKHAQLFDFVFLFTLAVGTMEGSVLSCHQERQSTWDDHEKGSQTRKRDDCSKIYLFEQYCKREDIYFRYKFFLI